MKRYGIQIISFNKPHYLKQTLDSLIPKLENDKLCVIEQSDNQDKQQEAIEICKTYPDIHVIPLFKNLGQRGATNLLFGTRFWDDCEYVMLSDHDNIFHESLIYYCEFLNTHPNIWCTSGYNSPEHDIEEKVGEWVYKSSCRAGHMVLRKSDFYSIMPSNEKAGESSWFCGLICSPF